MEFRWNEWNLDHAAKHGVGVPGEAETVVEGAAAPDPQDMGDGKWLVIGRGTGGRFVQVVYIIDDDGTLCVIHARPLSDREKRRHRRRTR